MKCLCCKLWGNVPSRSCQKKKTGLVCAWRGGVKWLRDRFQPESPLDRVARYRRVVVFLSQCSHTKSGHTYLPLVNVSTTNHQQRDIIPSPAAAVTINQRKSNPELSFIVPEGTDSTWSWSRFLSIGVETGLWKVLYGGPIFYSFPLPSSGMVMRAMNRESCNGFGDWHSRWTWDVMMVSLFATQLFLDLLAGSCTCYTHTKKTLIFMRNALFIFFVIDQLAKSQFSVFLFVWTCWRLLLAPLFASFCLSVGFFKCVHVTLSTVPKYSRPTAMNN